MYVHINIYPYGPMGPMERAGTLGPIWDPRAARSMGPMGPYGYILICTYIC